MVGRAHACARGRVELLRDRRCMAARPRSLLSLIPAFLHACFTALGRATTDARERVPTTQARPCRLLKYSAGNMSSGYRSEKSLGSFAFLACRPTYSALPSQHPHLLSAIDLQDGVHTPRERAIQLQSGSNTSSSSLVIGSHKGQEEKTHTKATKVTKEIQKLFRLADLNSISFI